MTLLDAIRQWRARGTQLFLERILGAPPDVMMLLGDRMREWAPYVSIESRALWATESRSRKLRALLRGRWRPSEASMQAKAREAFKDLLFGGSEDCGEDLVVLNDWHLRREWELNALTEADRARGTALASFTVLTRLRYKEIAASPLNLQLALRAPYVTDLIYPMVAKMPIVSLRYFLELHVHYAFNAIRRAKHPFSDHIISFLYDLLFLQQKIAIALLEYARLLTYAEEHKGEAQLINAEVDAIMAADALFAYLKASVEKTIALVGVTHGIVNLDAKKDHRKRIAALRAGLPAGVEDLPYGSFLFEMIGSESLEDLNNYRSGLLHKKGIADLQPHNYVGQAARAAPLRKVFGVLHEQHSKNTALLLVALALLTDRLVELDPPSFAKEDLPIERKLAEVRKRLEAEEVAATDAIELGRTQLTDDVPGVLFLKRARLRRLLGQHREALADLREAIARGSEPKADILLQIGVAWMDLEDEGRDAAAVDAFSRAIALRPDMDEAYAARALAYENLGDLASAAADLDVVIPRAAEPATFLEKRGQWRLALGRPADALADFEAAMSTGHEPVDVMTGRGIALRDIGDHAASLEALTAAVERYPEAVVARTHRAIALFAAGEGAAARADLDRIIEHSADHWKTPVALSIRAALRLQERDHAGAVADMEQAIARSQGTPPPEWIRLLAEIRGELQRGTDEA